MHASEVLQKCLPDVFKRMHAVRACALTTAVQALLIGRRLILMELARSWPGAERVRAPLKCLDRLLSNQHLAEEREVFYQSMMQWLIRQPTPIVLVDWSDLHADCRWQLLRASIPLSGRAFTIFEMVFPESMKGSPRAEKKFLKRLHSLMPSDITPILVTDAGFRAPWLQAVTKLGWHYVGRLRGRTRISLSRGKWLDHRDLRVHIGKQAQRVSAARITESNPYLADLVLFQKARRGRVCVSVRTGKSSRSNKHLKAKKREAEPWVLVVSPALSALHAKQIVSIYTKRMQIEQSFRDLKSERYGCAFKHSLTRNPQRIAILLLLHMLATFVVWLATLSLAVTALVNYGGIVSSRPKRHYSLNRIGWEALQRDDPSCNPLALTSAFKYPPPTFLALLDIPCEIAA
jgi:hypothetical protein